MSDKHNRSPFEFETLDDSVKDQDVKAKGDRSRGDDQTQFDGSHWGLGLASGIFKLGMPIFLILTWGVVLILEATSGGTGAKALSHWPVVMGNVDHISILKPISNWVVAVSAHHQLTGVMLTMFTKLASWFVMLICIAAAGFMHLSWYHLLSNLWLFILTSLVLWSIHIRGHLTVRLWFEFSCAGIGIIWFGMELLGFILQFDPHVHNVITVFGNSSIPIVGASVGAMGLLGFTTTQIVRQLRFSFYRGLLLIVMIAISMMMLYTDFQMLQSINALKITGATTFVVELMHLTGYGYGAFRGLEFHYKD